MYNTLTINIGVLTLSSIFKHSSTLIKILGVLTGIFVSPIIFADVRTTHSSLVSENASFFTPGALGGRVEAIAVEGDTVYVGGTFTHVQVQLDGEEIAQPYLFAYNKTTGNLITDFTPELNRPVRALHTTGEGTGIFVGGEFTIVNGETNRKGLVKLDNFGNRVSGFTARPNKRVYAMDRSGTTLYIGGNFDRVSQTDVEYVAAIDVTTGDVLPNVNLDFNGVISTNRTTGFPSVDAIEVTSDNQTMVVVGNFTSIDGLSRHRLAVIELGNQATVSTWNTDVFDVQCPASKFPQYINGIDISPDDTYFVTGSTGYRRPGLLACDSILRFDFNDLTDTDAQPTWVNFTGGDSVYEVAATDHAVYTGGHFRWLNNELTSNGNTAGPGAIPRRGLAALDPLNGLPLLNWRSDRNPRGVGVFALEVEPEGLYIGDDTDFLNGFKHAKFKFLPITTNVVARPTEPTLPTMVLNMIGGDIRSQEFTGSELTDQQTTVTNWTNVRGLMSLGGQLFHGDSTGNMWVSVTQNDGSLSPRTQVDLFGLSGNGWNVSGLSGMFFDYDRSRVYYTIQNDSRLFWRAFTPAGPVFGDVEYTANNQPSDFWNNIRGMDVIDNYLYFGSTNGNLYRIAFDVSSSALSGTSEVVSGPAVDGQNWSSSSLTFSSSGSILPPPNDPEFEFQSAGSSEVNSFKRFSFSVSNGEATDVQLLWDNPTAKLNVFLRDANGQLVDSVTDGSNSPIWLTAPPGAGGTYTVSVKIKEGSTSYTVQINPPAEPPTPLADYVFSSTGSDTLNSWQVFKFDVDVGDLIDAELTWDTNADINVFLRDETNSSVVRVTDGSGSPSILSTIATSPGRWSVGVSIKSGQADYQLLVNITQ